MRKLLLFFLLLMGTAAYSQKTVSGKVMDKAGASVPFTSVTVKGKNTGVQTDQNGEFYLRVSVNDVLIFSNTSFLNAELVVGEAAYYTVTMQRKENTIQEVVVTSAFNITRSSRSVSSNIQSVNADKLNTVRSPNINNALAGKVAGVQVRSQSGAALGRETAVRLRGENALGAGAGAIYVVDGTIISSASSLNGVIISGSSDINLDDVEELNVLQGPAAAALFGPDGSNGAIVITTKKGRKNNTSGIEVNSAIYFDNIFVTPKYQNAYAGGSSADFYRYTWQPGQPLAWKSLDGKFYHDYIDDASWGPRIAGQEYIPWYAWYGGHENAYKTARLTAQPSNVRDFYNQGITKQNNINFVRGGDNYKVRVSYTNLDVEGIIPGTYLKKNSFNTNVTLDLNPYVSVNANINYMNQQRNAENNDNYANAGSGSFNQWFHRDLDMNIMRNLRYLRTPGGIYASWNHNNPAAYSATDESAFYSANYWLNPFTFFDLVKAPDNRDRFYGDAGITFKITRDLKIRGTYRRNQLVSKSSLTYPSEMEKSSTQSSFNQFEGNGLAGYGITNISSTRQNYELLASYSKKIRSFQLNGNAGIDLLKSLDESYRINTVGGLKVPGLYSIANSESTPKNSSSATGNTQAYIPLNQRAWFVRADAGYKNTLFVEGSFRRNFLSSEPAGKSIDAYSMGASVIFSEWLKDKSILSYGKIRASVGQVNNRLAAFQLYNTYTPNAADVFTMSEPNTFIDPSLHGSVNTEKEIGIETRWLKNRIGFSFTYWDRSNTDFPVSVSISSTTGYNGFRTNAGKIEKKGIELQAFLNPVRSEKFDWRLDASFSKLIRNQVVSIAPGVNRLTVASGAFSGSSSAYTVSSVDQPWGQLFGGGIKKLNGKPVLQSNGLYTKQTEVNFGSVLPDYTGGVQSSMKLFERFSLNVNVDYQVGGKFFSLSDFWGTYSGLTARTATLNDKGNSVRDQVADGGGVRVDGVDASGKDVTYYVDAQTYFHQFRQNNIAENSVFDLTYVKLRELSIGYDLPVAKLFRTKWISGINFSLVGRNVLLLYTKNRDFDPSEISQVQGEDGQMPGTRSLGFNLKLNF
ncbi:MAG: SusC/RagA family TonB-linked outer membrane protein [Ferruginibacter sp.]